MCIAYNAPTVTSQVTGLLTERVQFMVIRPSHFVMVIVYFIFIFVYKPCQPSAKMLLLMLCVKSLFLIKLK